jgi:3-oxoacyl-[acyl-carrier protein] reductase
MVKSVIDATGRIDILINCAGGFFFTETADQVTEERWDFIVDLNMKSVFLCSQAVYDTMKEQKSGCIVNISSSAGRMPVQSAPVHYAAAKAGVISLTQVIARELAPFGVRVNAVAPGTTPTQRVVKLRGTSDPEVLKQQIARVPLGRMASVADSTAAALFLASDQASFITGHTIDVNGGVLMF